jgi:transposase
MLLRRKEKERQVIKLAEEGKSTSDIAKEVHISLKDIGKVIRKATGDSQGEGEKKEKEKLILSPYARAFQMFKDKTTLGDMAIELDIKTDVVLNFHEDYLRLERMNGLVKTYNDLRNDFPIFFHLYRRIKKDRLGKEDITEIVENQQDLSSLKEE